MKHILDIFIYFLFSPQETVRLLMSMQVDRMDLAKLTWNKNYLNPNSAEYRDLEQEAVYAVSVQIWQ